MYKTSSLSVRFINFNSFRRKKSWSSVEEMKLIQKYVKKKKKKKKKKKSLKKKN